MTIKEFCTEYGKSETNVRAKIAHNKDKLKDHVSKSPYTRTITLDDFAVSFLLEDRRSKSSSDESFTRKTEENEMPKGASVNDTVDIFQNWSDVKKKRVMDICMEQVKKQHRQLSYIPDSFKTKELCRCTVENYGLALQYVPECFVTKELCDIAVKSNSVALSYVPDKFKSSEMIQTAFNNYSEARKHCISSDELDRDSNLLQYVPEVFRTESICFKSLLVSDCNVKYIPAKYLNTDKFIEKMIRSPVSRKYIPLSFWTKDKIKETLQKDNQTNYAHCFGLNGYPKECFNYELYVEFIDQKLIDSMDIYRSDYYSAVLTREEMKKIRQIDIDEHNRLEKIYALIQQDSKNIRLMPTDNEKYSVYALTAVCKCGEALRYVPMEMRTENMCQAAVEDNPDAILYVPDEYRQQIIENIRERNDWIKYIFDDGYLSDLFIN